MWPVLAPCIFTAGRLVCALVIVVSTFEGARQVGDPATRPQGLAAFDRAAKAIAVAIVFDVLDGSVARLLGSASSFGVQLDSLADIVAFGMAPAVLGLYWGIQPVRAGSSGRADEMVVAAAWCVFVAFLGCAVFRLARFNLDADLVSPGDRYFVGLPVPGAAAVIAAVVYFAKQPLDDWREGAAWLGVVTMLAALMVSRIRYALAEPYPAYLRTWLFRVPVGGLLLWALWVHSEVTVLVGVLACATSGPVSDLVRRLSADRRRPTT